MTPQALKASILQLAIQGKLVPQHPEEGTAEDLYQQIQAEKQRLIAEGKIKKEKPLPPIEEDKLPFDIPETWKWVRLGEIILVKGGKRIPAGRKLSDSNTGHVYIRVSDMENGTVNLSNLRYVPNDIYPEISNYIIKKEDIYITVAGSIGKIGKIPAILDGANLTENADRLIIFHSNQEWLIYALQAGAIMQQIHDATKKVGQPKLAIKRIETLYVPLPPLEEQKRIVAKIKEMLPLVERYGEAYEQLQAFNKRFPDDLRKSILQEAIQGKLVPQRPEEGTAEDLYQQIQAEKKRLIASGTIKKEKPLPPIEEKDLPFDIPETWKWVRLGEIGNTNIGLTYKPQDIASTGTTVLRSSNIQDGQMKYDDIVRVTCDIPANKMCHKGDILICARNGSKKLVGKAALIDCEGMSFGAFMAIYRSICNPYIVYVINSSYFRNSLLNDSDTTTINQLTQDMLKNFILPLPPQAEQKRIVAKIREMVAFCVDL